MTIRWSKVVKLGLVTPELEAARNVRLAAKKAGDKVALAAAKKAFGEAFKAACAAKSLDYLRLKEVAAIQQVTVVEAPTIPALPVEPAVVPVMREVAPNAASTHVYVIHMVDNLHKIGITNDIKSRLATLQTASPYDLTVVSCVAVANPRNVEKALHGVFAGQRTRSGGEWFNVPANVILAELAKHV